MPNKIVLPNNRAIIVLGMHRSGTSALTRILNLLGVELGNQLLPQHATNETGFWEHFAIVRIQEQILQSLDSSWFDTAPLPEKWWELAKLALLRVALKEVLRREFAESPLWGIKDPRLCRLLPLWIPLLQELGTKPHFVIIARHPLEVAASLEARDGLSYNTSLRLWLEYVLAGVQDSQAFPRVFVTYDELLQDWQATVSKIAQTLQISWHHALESVAGEVEAFLSPNLKHHVLSPQQEAESKIPTANVDLLAWSHAIYQAICHATKGNHQHLTVVNSISSLLHHSTKIQQTPTKPHIHLVIHLSKKQINALKITLEALRAQVYPHWYLSIVADFNNTDMTWWEFPNMRWLHIDSNRQATATINREIAIIGAQWVALMMAGDRFEPNLLSVCLEQINRHPDWQFIYVDEESKYVPKCKPDFNLDLLRSMPYLGSFCLIHRQAQQAVGGYAPYFDLANEDIALKIWEQYGENAFGHIAQVLYHRAQEIQFSNQTWFSSSDKRYQQILQQHLQRQDICAQVHPTKFKNIYWIDYALQHNSLVSIIIATRNGGQSLQRCLDSVWKLTAYSYFEIILIDNHSDDVDTLAYLESLKAKTNIRLLFCSYETTPAELNHLATKNAQGGYLVFLNDDTEILEAHWLQRLLAINQRQEVGIVAPRLLDAQQRVVHAGLILGMGSVGIAGQINQGLASKDLGYMARAQATQNFSAVSDSCLMIRTSIYQQIDGMDIETCSVLFNEVDFCLKVTRAGYKIVWTPHVTLRQHGTGSLVRNRQQVIDNSKINQEIAAMYDRWLPQLCHDPAYNPNLCLNGKEWQPETQMNVPWVSTKSATQLTPNSPFPKIVAFPHDAWGCGEYRVRAPLRALQQAGLAEYALMPNDDVGRIPTLTEFGRMQADTVFLHNFLHEEQLQTLQQYRRFPHCFKVFGQDDLIYALPKTNPYSQTNYKDMKNRVQRAISLCDRLIVTTEPIAQAYYHLGSDIQIIPNYIEWARWQNFSPKRQVGQKPRIGWAGAAQHQGDLKLIFTLVKALAKEVEWIFFGLCPEELRPYIHECYDMVPFEQYPAKLASLNLDLAIAPLEQNAFNEAKSNLRLLEYGILGYPIVCSDIEPYQNAPVKRVANTESAWLEAVRERIDDLEATAKEGEELKQWVIHHWLLEDHLTQWGQALNVMATSKPLKFSQSQNPKTKSQWIFLLGCEHSGTQLLAQMLCQLQSIVPAKVSTSPLEKIVKIPPLWTEKEALVSANQTSSILKTSEVYPESDTYLLVEGLPANMGKALWLQQQFPDAYFIHLIRDGYAVALELHDQIQQDYGVTPLLLHRAARQWQRSLDILQADIPKLRHFLEIGYEDLLDKPETVLNNLLHFLNLKPINTQTFAQNHNLSNLARQNAKRIAQMSAEQRAVIKNCLGKGTWNESLH